MISNLSDFKRKRNKAGKGRGTSRYVENGYLRLETGEGDRRLGENERDLLRTTGDLDLYLGTGERELLLCRSEKPTKYLIHVQTSQLLTVNVTTTFTLCTGHCLII